MNLYDLHPKPETLKGYEQRFDVPELAWVELISRNHKLTISKRFNPDLFRDLEPGLMKEPAYAFTYARNFLKGRWTKAEPVIMKSPEWAVRYAEQVIKGRWPEAEPFILKNSAQACNYAIDVLKQRWPKAERIIAKSQYWRREYEDWFKVKL